MHNGRNMQEALGTSSFSNSLGEILVKYPISFDKSLKCVGY